MRGDRHQQPARQQAARAHPRLGRLDGRERPGQHAQLFAVDGGDVAAGGQEGLQFGFGQRDGGHGAGLHRLHQAAALGHDAQRVLEPEHAREAGRDVLAEAVAQHQRGPHAARHPQPRHRVLGDEQQRLRVLDAREPRVGLRLRLRLRRGVQQRAQVLAEDVLEQRAAAVDLLAEHRMVAVQREAHVGVLRAAAREQEDDLGRRLGRALRRIEIVRGRAQRLQREGGVARHHRGALREGTAAVLQGLRDIGQRCLGMAPRGGRPAAPRPPAARRAPAPTAAAPASRPRSFRRERRALPRAPRARWCRRCRTSSRPRGAAPGLRARASTPC